MDTRERVAPRSYDDFVPPSEWKQGEDTETLVISLPGFKKEQLRVQMNNLGNLRVSGERPLGNDRWSRFRKDFRIPENAKANDTRAKFENENLYVIMPKFNKKSQPQSKTTKAQELELSKKTTTKTESKQDRDQKNQKDSAPSSSKVDGGAPKQSNGRSGKIGESVNNAKDALTSDVKATNYIRKPKDKWQPAIDKTVQSASTKQEMAKDELTKPEGRKQPATDDVDKDAELLGSRKRKSEDDTFHDAGSKMEPKMGVLGMRFKKPRRVMLNVGVAAVILIGLAFYGSYRMRKSIDADSN